MLNSPTNIFDNNHITTPAGAATKIARPKTKSVLSKTERIITLQNCGFLYGGSSRVKKDGSPFKIVIDKIFDVKRVIKSPKIISIDKYIAQIKLFKTEFELNPTKNIVMSAISVGKRPLHGVKLLVNIAIILSRGESMILQPTTPAALHPKPIHVINTILSFLYRHAIKPKDINIY